MAYIGDYFLYAATLCSLLSGVSFLFAWRGKEHLVGLGRSFFRIVVLTTLAATGVLIYLIFTHDFTVAYVYSYSSSDLPWYYLISALWGGQEGTLLLWVMLTAVMGLFMMASAGEFENGNMFWLNLFVLFILVILIKKSPFELMPVLQNEGAGLNPLLLNFWMTLHPPLMFVAYAAIVFPFTFAMTALVERKYDQWADAARKWTTMAWTVLGVSIVMGCYWSYETLGWGGYWAWDPVENASLIPWIFLTAQIHTLFIKKQRHGLMRFSLVMVCLSFWSVLYGTFLTRSGVLGDFSVHSFVDLGINQFLVGGLLLFIAIGLFLLLARWRGINTEPSFSTIKSRTYMTALGIVVLFVGGVLVLLGTSAPLLTRVMENPSAVDLDYYFKTMAPISILILLLIAISPSLRWSAGITRPLWLIIGAVVMIAVIVTLIATGITTSVVYLMLFGLGAAAVITNLFALVRKLGMGKLSSGSISHIGIALMLLGASASSGLVSTEMVTLPQGETIRSMEHDLIFAGTQTTRLGVDCEIEVTSESDNFIALLAHERHSDDMVMKKPHIQRYVLSDLYFSPVALEDSGTVSPGELYLKKNQLDSLDKYQITFRDFETSGHGDGKGMAAAAVLEISYDDTTEIVRPKLVASGTDISYEMDSFDLESGKVSISGIRPEEGGVFLSISGGFVPPEVFKPATLVVEISRKPLIQLFWVGTLIIFVSGIVSLARTRKFNHNLTGVGDTQLSTQRVEQQRN